MKSMYYQGTVEEWRRLIQGLAYPASITGLISLMALATKREHLAVVYMYSLENAVSDYEQEGLSLPHPDVMNLQENLVVARTDKEFKLPCQSRDALLKFASSKGYR